MLFSVSQRPSVPYQFLGNRNKKSCRQFSGLRSRDRAHMWIPFCNLLLFCKTTQSWFLFLKIWIVIWPCDIVIPLATLVMALVISLVPVLMSLVLVFLLNFIFCLNLPCITIYEHTLPEIKHPCFTRDFGPPHPSIHHFLSVDSHPWVPVCKDHNSNAFRYSHLENPTDRGAWLATVRGITKSRT